LQFAQRCRVEAGGKMFALHLVDGREHVHEDKAGLVCCGDFTGKCCARA
jgi:hypothetical protein